MQQTTRSTTAAVRRARPGLASRHRGGVAAAVLSVHLLALSGAAGGALAQTAPAFTPREESPEDYPAGAGREETFYTCTACHNFKLVAAQGMSRRQWDDSLSWMTQRHNMPPLAGKERDAVLGYLEATFPPRAPAARGWQNPFVKQ